MKNKQLLNILIDIRFHESMNKFEEIYEQVEKKEMPLDSYTWIHSEANLTQEQIAAVVNWAKQVQSNYKEQMKTN